MASGLPFDDFRSLIRQLPGPDLGAVARTSARIADLATASGDGGRIDALATWLSRWSGKSPPTVARPLVAVFAASHGSAVLDGRDPVAPVRARLELSAAGGSATSQVCAASDIGLRVFELALDHPTGDITVEAALDEKSCAATMAFGMEVLAAGADLIALGNMSCGHDAVAAALCLGLFGGAAEDWTADARQAELARKAAACHAGHLRDPLEALRRLGGREFAAIAGAILAARMERVPLVLDGFAATAAAAVLHVAAPGALDHCLVAQVEPGAGHARLLREIGLRPLLDLGHGQGEGVCGALAIQLVRSAATIHAGTVTRSQAAGEAAVTRPQR